MRGAAGAVWAVIRREYLQRVRSRWFVLATLGAPLFLVLTIAVPAWFGGQGAEVAHRLAVVDGTDTLYQRLEGDLRATGWEVEEVRWTSTVVDTLRRRASEGEIGAFLLLDQFTLEAGDAVLYTRRPLSPAERTAVRAAVVRAALAFRLEQEGVDVEAMLAGGGLDVQPLGPGADALASAEQRFLVAYVGAFLLYTVILLYAVSVMRATLEEKTSRIVEIVISAIRPWHLMLGKILGVGAVGLTQIAVWVGASLLLVRSGLADLLGGGGSRDATGAEALAGILPGPGALLLFVGFFVLGYFIYSALYAAVGAMCSTDDEAQQAQLPLVMFLVVPIVFVTHVIRQPDSALSVALSLVPLFSPILMWARVAGGGVPAWQVALSFVLMALAVVAVAWIAGRVYRTGILMTGKRPTLRELWRWVREA